MDEVSSTKQLASIFPKLYANQLRHSARHGWLVRDGDVWQPNEEAALQTARTFCLAAARQLRDRRLGSEATVETVMRLASFEPGVTAAIPKDHMLFALSASGRAAI